MEIATWGHCVCVRKMFSSKNAIGTAIWERFWRASDKEEEEEVTNGCFDVVTYRVMLFLIFFVLQIIMPRFNWWTVRPPPPREQQQQ